MAGIPSNKHLVMTAAICLPIVLVWKHSAMVDYLESNIAPGTSAGIADYQVSDAARIVAAAGTDRDTFNRDYLRKPLSGDVLLIGDKRRGGSGHLIETKTAGENPVTISCGMNGFAYTASQGGIASLAAGAVVHISGPIDPETGGRTIALADGCTIGKSDATQPTN